MHVVVETAPYLRRADECGLSERERADIVTLLAERPDLGDVIPGTGGVRKVRVAAQGRGKSGGVRVVTFYSGPNLPVFLLTVYAKGVRADLKPAERAAFASLTKQIVEAYARRAASRNR